MLAAIGAGSLVPAIGQGGTAQSSSLSEALSFDSSVRSGGFQVNAGGQAGAVPAIEQWEDLLDDLDGVELVSRYTPLTRTEEASRGIMGRCPFCRHWADSLVIDGRDDSYFCTECHVGGHALDFYARIERLSLSDAISKVRRLLTSGQLKGKRPRLERLWYIVDESNRFAQDALVHSREGESVRAWLDPQGVTSETVEGFLLGVMSCALGKQLLKRLLAMGFSPDELARAGVDGWMACKEDRVRNGEPDLTLLLPLRDGEGHAWGFYEQSMEETADVVWSSYFSPYGYRLLSPHRAARLVFSASNAQDSASSVLLVGRPWDVVLFAQGGLEQAVYVSPLDPGEYR